MASNPFSSLNPTKMELIWLSSSRRINLLSTSPIRLFGTAIRPSQSIRDLGVIVDSDLSLSAHVSHITSVCFYYLRQLLVRWSLTMDAAHSLVWAMIQPSRLLQQSARWPTYWPDVTSTVSFTCGHSTCARPAWSCSSVSSHAWYTPLVEFPTACHVQVMSADIQVSARSGTQLPVALLHVADLRSWPSSVTLSWCKQTAGPTVLHDQFWTTFLRVFWLDCLEWHAGSLVQFRFNSKGLQTTAENRCSGLVTASTFVTVLIC